MLSKKSVLIITIIGTVIFFLSLFSEKIGICNPVTSCGFVTDQVAENFLIFIPFFLLSLITYKMRDEVFRVWSKFALVWIPASMFLILVAPEYGNALLPIVKGTVAFFTSLLFTTISLIIIVWKYINTRKS